MESDKVWPVIVVGAGGAHGSACLLSLSRRGVQALGLEAQPSAPHSFGSSHGLSRIIRMAYFEHPSYVPLVRESYRLWRQLEAECGQRLLTMTGCVNASAPGAQCGPGLSCFQGAMLSARQHGLPHEVLSPGDVERRFPGYRLPSSFQTMYEPDGGFLAPEACIEAQLAQAQRRGARLLCGARVQRWRVLPARGRDADGSEQGGLVQVETCRGTFTARRLVLAAGAWMPLLVPQLAPVLHVERQVVGWFEVAPDKRHLFAPEVFPVFLLQDEQAYYYGFPADQHGLKVGKFHHLGEETSADRVDRSVSPADEAALRACLRRYFPSADSRLVRAAVCLFTNTPDTNFILDLHPAFPQVVLASCCSGHGFKFAPALGEILADLALTGGTAHDIALHRLSPQRPGQTAVLQALAAAGSPEPAARL